MQRSHESHEGRFGITGRPINIILSDTTAMLSVGVGALWKQLSQDSVYGGRALLLDGLVTLFVDAIVRTELGAVGKPQRVTVKPPALYIAVDDGLLSASRPPDSSDLRVRGVESLSELEQKAREQLREPYIEAALEYLRCLGRDTAKSGLFAASTSNGQIRLLNSGGCFRFIAKDLVFETRPEYDVFMDETSFLFRDRTRGLLVNELGWFTIKNKDSWTDSH